MADLISSVEIREQFIIGELERIEKGAKGPRLLDVGDEPRRVLLYQPLQVGLLGAVAFVVERGAIGLPLGLPADGLHDGLPVGVSPHDVKPCCAQHSPWLQPDSCTRPAPCPPLHSSPSSCRL